MEYVGTSGATLTTDDIAKFPTPPDSVALSWVVAFVGDATSDTSPSGDFVCTGGSFCSGDNLDQDLIAALKQVGNSQVQSVAFSLDITTLIILSRLTYLPMTLAVRTRASYCL